MKHQKQQMFIKNILIAVFIGGLALISISIFNQKLDTEKEEEETIKKNILTSAEEKEIDKTIDKELKKFDALFDDLFVWMAKLYDPETGGFYSAMSAVGKKEFQPCIEPTGQALNILQAGGLIKPMPQFLKDKFIHFFQSRQDPETGLFFDPHNNSREIERIRGRYLFYAMSSLDKFSIEALYKINIETKNVDYQGNKDYFEHLQSVKTFKTWLNERPWDNSWKALDHVQAQYLIIKRIQDENLKKELTEFLFKYLAVMQDSETGWWGGGKSPYVLLSGALKASLIYESREIPNANKIYKSMLEVIRNEEANNACFVRNPLDLFGSIRKSLKYISKKDQLEILQISIRNASKFIKEDGGFSYGLHNAATGTSGLRFCEGLSEGDMNGTTQMINTTRIELYKIAERKPPPLPGAIRFYEVLYKRLNIKGPAPQSIIQ